MHGGGGGAVVATCAGAAVFDDWAPDASAEYVDPPARAPAIVGA